MRYLKGVSRCVIVGTFVLASVFANAQLRSVLVTGGLTLPVAIVQDPTDPNVFMVVEQRSGTTGRVRAIQNGTLLATPFLSVSPVSTGSEQGLLGLAFAPDYATSGFFYVNYTDSAGNTNIVRYQVSSNPLIANGASATLIFKITQPFANHNGGSLVFGSDGFLYIGTGDGGSANDPGNRAQNGLETLGKMLRIDPTGDDFPLDPNKNFRIPAGNPFIGDANFLPEIWAIGLRNPWKYTFDPAAMLGYDSWLIADVGQNAREEIDYEFPGQSGRNYGWRVWEGNLLTPNGGQNPFLTTNTFPIFDYTHAVGQSITGGYVYRGIELGPEYFGTYFYADYINSQMWVLALNVDPVARTVSAGTNTPITAAVGASNNISTFGVDSNGELLFAKYGVGQIYRIKPLNRVWMTSFASFDSRLVGGTLRHLVAADSNSVRVSPLDAIDRQGSMNFKGGVFVQFMTDQLTTPNLNATIRVSTNQSVGGTARLLLRKWTTGDFVEVGNGAFGTTLTNVVINGIPAANYRRGDGVIEARIRGDVSVASTASRIVVNFDQVWMTSN